MGEQEMRDAIAKEYGIALYRQYGEEQAAHILNVDPSTLKRWRAAGHTLYVRMGPRKIRYLGVHLADLLAKGMPWDDTQSGNSRSENTGSPKSQGAPHGAAHGSMPKQDKPDAHLLAQTIFKSPSKS